MAYTFHCFHISVDVKTDKQIMKDKIFNVYFSVKKTLQGERGFTGERIHSSVAVYFLIEI